MIGTPSETTSLSRRQPRVTSASRSRTNAGSSWRLSNGPSTTTTGAKSSADDVLRERRIAADVPLGGRVQHLGIEHADDVAQVEIAIGELGDVLAADVAEIAFVAFGHGSSCEL